VGVLVLITLVGFGVFSKQSLTGKWDGRLTYGEGGTLKGFDVSLQLNQRNNHVIGYLILKKGEGVSYDFYITGSLMEDNLAFRGDEKYACMTIEFSGTAASRRIKGQIKIFHQTFLYLITTREGYLEIVRH